MIRLASDRIRELARQPFLRPGGVDFDASYALAVMDAREIVWLEEEVNASPGKAVAINIGQNGEVGVGSRGFVPDGDGGGTAWRYAPRFV